MSSTKINLAVAGVTNGLGHAIATALVANPSVNTVTLLTRASPSSSVSEVLEPLVKQGAILRPVDYASLEDITAALQAGVKRFAPSEMSISKEANYIVEHYRTKLAVWEKAKESGWSIPRSAVGYVPSRRECEGAQGRDPGDGNYRMTFTTLEDIGKFVSAAVTLEKWPEELGLAGETLTYNEIVRKAEEVIGEKFSVTYFSWEELQSRHAESLEKKDGITQFLTEMFSAYLEGMGEIKDPYLSKTTDVKPTSIVEFLNTYWSKA
ncbi:hypothetical protein BDQ17DRAFT_1329126 [Cyathus striatus]|nr:hypothetical protein BDQ17DRAFT_1329126 [Cyathus striatus]